MEEQDDNEKIFRWFYLQIIKLKKILMNKILTQIIKAEQLLIDLNGQEITKNRNRDTKAGCQSDDQP